MSEATGPAPGEWRRTSPLGYVVGAIMNLRNLLLPMAAALFGTQGWKGGVLYVLPAVLAAIGLILPAAFDLVPVLVPLAALGLVLLMAGAVITRIRRHEPKPMLADLGYLALAAFVAWGRFGPASF